MAVRWLWSSIAKLLVEQFEEAVGVGVGLGGATSDLIALGGQDPAPQASAQEHYCSTADGSQGSQIGEERLRRWLLLLLCSPRFLLGAQVEPGIRE
jgi:hypothetical protein